MSEGGPFKRLLKYMSPHKGTIRLATLCSVLNKIWDLAPPLLIGLAVDVVVQRDESFLAGFPGLKKPLGPTNITFSSYILHLGT
ncbi:MAG: hypothetical protein CM15mP71_3460 [Candidatus Poseidoniales archaeon]|nr:MAG: hypothetical protein CM15mP71_3460 [Candidatus Poseidoniales archaeon]